MHHYSTTVLHPKEGDQESLKFSTWCLGPFETIPKQPQFKESKGEWLVQEQERIIEMSVGADTVMEFANIMGLGHMDQDTFLAAVRCYAIRKELLADFAGKMFVLVGLWITMWSRCEDKRQPSLAGQGPSEKQVAELVHMLAATKLENETLRVEGMKVAAIPRLSRQQLKRLIMERLPYQWI